MCGVFALSQTPHVDPLFIKILLDVLDFDTCSKDTKVKFKDQKGHIHEVPAHIVRKRVFVNTLGNSVSISLDSNNPVAGYNRNIQLRYLMSLQQLEGLAKLVQGEAAYIPGKGPEPSAETMARLNGLIQEEVGALATACKHHAFRFVGSVLCMPCWSVASFFNYI